MTRFEIASLRVQNDFSGTDVLIQHGEWEVEKEPLQFYIDFLRNK